MAAGDEAALGALYDRSHDLLYSLILRVVGDAEDAEEVLEETFWQAWRQAARYEEGRGSVGGWLATIARSRALDRLRARRRVREERWEELPEPDADAGAADVSDPLENAEAAETRTIVRAALLKLPAEQREALELAYFGGLSQSEISERTGQPLGTVKTRMRLAMQKLKEGLSVLRERAP